MPSIISTDVVIQGSLRSEGEVQLDGQVTGDIMAKKLIISDNAHVEGDVSATEMEVRGSVNGSINSYAIKLTASARVKGDISYQTLEIENGAAFNGRTSQSEQPLVSNFTTVGDEKDPLDEEDDSIIDLGLGESADQMIGKTKTAKTAY